MSEWDPWRRYERERERRIWDPLARLEYQREREQWDPWYRLERNRERYFTDPMYRFEKETDRLSWDPYYRTEKWREWKYDEGAMFRDRVLSDLDRGSKIDVSRSAGNRHDSEGSMSEWWETAKIKAYVDLYYGPRWVGWLKVGLGISMIVGALVWYFFFLP